MENRVSCQRAQVLIVYFGAEAFFILTADIGVKFINASAAGRLNKIPVVPSECGNKKHVKI